MANQVLIVPSSDNLDEMGMILEEMANFKPEEKGVYDIGEMQDFVDSIEDDEILKALAERLSDDLYCFSGRDWRYMLTEDEVEGFIRGASAAAGEEALLVIKYTVEPIRYDND